MIILDSSAALRCTLPQADLSERDKFRHVVQSEPCLSPVLFLSEISNALWKEIRFRGLEIEMALEFVETITQMTTLYNEDAEIMKAALKIAVGNQHPVYDCTYIVLSRVMDAPILTADKKLRRKFPDDKFIEIEA